MQQKNENTNQGVLTIEEYLRRRNLIRTEEPKEESGIHRGESENVQVRQNKSAETMRWSSAMELAELLYV